MGGTSTKTTVHQDVKGSDGKVLIGDSAITKMGDTPVQKALQSASKVIEGGADILTAPAVWLKDMQKNWLMYMIVIAVILLTTSFLYCAIRAYLNRKGNNSSISHLIQFASLFSNKNSAFQTGFPSAAPPPVVELQA